MTSAAVVEHTDVGTEPKFRVQRDDFADAVAWAARALPSRPTAPILAGLLLHAEAGELTVSGFDFDSLRQARLPGEIGSHGRVLVSGRLLSEITKALPDRPIDIDMAGSHMTLQCGSAKFSLPAMPVEDYPTLPASPPRSGDLAGELFAQAVGQVAAAAGRDEHMPFLTGVQIKIDGNKIVLAATDRYRLAVREIDWQPAVEQPQAVVVVPAKTLADTAKATPPGEQVQISLDTADTAGTSRLLGIDSGDRHSTTRLLDVDFPKYERLFPTDYTAVATLAVPELLEAIKLVALVADKGAPIRLHFDTDGSLQVSASGADLGAAEEYLPAAFAGDELTIGFNAGYLIDGLTHLNADTVTFGFTTPVRAAVLHPGAGPATNPGAAGPFPALHTDYRYLIQPVRLSGTAD